ncbi:hypothetical protein [Brevundimonas sp.]|uniref:hypothetical protein n=1 Tax=Brevundimonas sp. TaxID=1871086 RepID=UPI0025F304DB|nr:hypothetical protein [Brevundimonas sp.]
MILRLLLKWGLAIVAALTVLALADAAGAQSCPDECPPPPPPPCEDECPPPPCEDECHPPPPPPSCGIEVCIDIDVNVGARASAASRAQARVEAFAESEGLGRGSGLGRGYASFSVQAPPPTVINNLVVQGAARVVRVPYQERRRMERRVVIQAVCIDSRSVPHPASRIRPDRDIRSDYIGELYRCIAGSWLQVTIATYEGGEFNFDGGESLTCRAGEALYHGAGGLLECRPQTPERDCFERSLLRRFGAGVFVLTMVREELYEEYREETVVETYSGMSLVLDGGVGGRVY